MPKNYTTHLTPGDRIAYTARFVRDVCGGLHSSGAMRGTLIRHDGERLAWVHWDEDPADVETMVAACNIAKVGSVRFADVRAEGGR